jgi:hypothetical protein
MPAKKAFGQDKLEKLNAVCLGWKIRRILKLKDT